MRVELFVGDFHLEAAALSGAAVERLPELPGLDALLCQGRPLSLQPDWRSALLAQVGCTAEVGASAPASIAATLLDCLPQRAVCFAQPVHRVAGLTQVNLHPAGLLRLGAEEAAGWSEDFNRAFVGSGLHLHPLAPTLLLEGLHPADLQPAANPQPQAQHATDPARWLGATLPASLLGMADRATRQLSAEIEMWLHEHPRNRQRERRGELAVNGLWLWGAAQMSSTQELTAQRSDARAVAGRGNEVAAQALSALPPAFGDDVFLRGLWRMRGGVVTSAQRFADLPTSLDTAVVVCSAAALDTRDSPMQRLEADWFAPLRAALARRELRQLRLWMGGRGWRVEPRPAWLPSLRWRTPAPWWHKVAI
jgi:hypothetical protein